MPIIIKFTGVAQTGETLDPPLYLEGFYPFAPDPNRMIFTTEDPRRAKVFADHAAAFAIWNTIYLHDPTRPDGRPNKPLTAFHTEFVEAPKAVAL